MGQGQSDVALHLLRECASNGDWLCLKNLHLMIHWLSVLEKVRPTEDINMTVHSHGKNGSDVFSFVRLDRHATLASVVRKINTC